VLQKQWKYLRDQFSVELRSFICENFLLLRERESKHCFFKKKYVDNNKEFITRLLQNVRLEDSYVDEEYTNC